jgi:2-polyprenyl-3-methyl-5-hydroxy-6-metoxy-1,4-benzoquinol methylase
MNPIYLLKNLDLLADCKTVLDVGARDGVISSQFVVLGMEVDAIDIRTPELYRKGVNFEQISVDKFLEKNNKHYDIVIARHVMHLLDNPTKVIKDLQKISGVFFFTCFGPKDDWADTVTVLSHDEVLSMFAPESVKHHSEAFQHAKTYAGDVKYWHIHTFVIDNRN